MVTPSGSSQKIFRLNLFLSDWKPTNGSGGTVTSVERPLRIELKGSPTVAEDVYYHVGHPLGYLRFTLDGNLFRTFNSAGLTSLQDESFYPGLGIIQFRQQDGFSMDCTGVINAIHISKLASNKFQFACTVQKFNEGIENVDINPFAN